VVSLQKIADQWRFVSEASLENFVWEHLFDLFNLTPLQQQYVCQGEICDILAVNADRQLHILELKNVEDRYLVQQLTRYYANLNEVQPFADQIDYAHPIRLLAIAPSYHRHNLVDQQHNTLKLELWRFHLSEQESQVWFHLTALESQACHQLQIPSQFTNTKPNFSEAPIPPDHLLAWLGGCTEAEQIGILGLRAQLLARSDRIKEALDGNWIRYGNGKSKLCCEIYFERKRQRPILFLWLPTPSSHTSPSSKIMIGRLRLWLNGTTISHVGHIAKGLGKMRLQSEWEQLPREKRPKSLLMGLSYKSNTPVEIKTYLRCHNEVPQPDYWKALGDMALAAWDEK
jgi:RecB family endonuclease NucS